MQPVHAVDQALQLVGGQLGGGRPGLQPLRNSDSAGPQRADARRGCAGRAGRRRWWCRRSRRLATAAAAGPSRGRAGRVRGDPTRVGLLGRSGRGRACPSRSPSAVHVLVPTAARRSSRRSHRAASAGALDAPLALHAQVRVQGEAVVEAVQEVLAPADDLEGRGAAQVGGGDLGEPQVAEHDPAARQRLVQSVGGAPDGVALRHGAPSSPAAQRRRRRSPAQPQPARRGVEAGLGQAPATSGWLGPEHRAAVGLLDGEPPERTLADGEGQRVGGALQATARRRSTRAGSCRRARRRGRARRRPARPGRRPCGRAGDRAWPCGGLPARRRAGTTARQVRRSVEVVGLASSGPSRGPARAAPRRRRWPGRWRPAPSPGTARSASSPDGSGAGAEPVDGTGRGELGRRPATRRSSRGAPARTPRRRPARGRPPANPPGTSSATTEPRVTTP